MRYLVQRDAQLSNIRGGEVSEPELTSLTFELVTPQMVKDTVTTSDTVSFTLPTGVSKIDLTFRSRLGGTSLNAYGTCISKDTLVPIVTQLPF